MPSGGAWFQQPDSLRLIGAIQRDVAAHLPPAVGPAALVLRACAGLAPPPLGPGMRRVLSLVRGACGFEGDVRCAEHALPLESGSISLLYAAHVLETATDPAALLAEFRRVLRPEGLALIVALNPWSATRLRWQRQVPAALAPGALARMADHAGLRLEARHYVGPYWRADERWREAPEQGALRPLRAAYLIQARSREPGLIAARRVPTRRLRAELRPG
ncbi:methyltransferase domain-containing protein [Coralloluteibacterium thermophilus]|uniref:Methyltransferase domain-containing protein n=1 Tax=Coralloluteibacterium thermophilum TaxID=2707049 RepID=A0ABV9NHT8_9GAMM